MKVMKCILLFVVCVAMAACGGENSKYEPYKEKMLETLAGGLGTTKDLLVKDLEIKIDSMSLSNFLVEDSINMLTQQYNEAEAETAKRIEKTNEKINEYEEKAKTATGVSIFVNRSFRDDSKRELKRLESVLKSIKEKYENAMATLEPRDKKEVIYQVFHFKITSLNPKTKIHEVRKRSTFFTADGQKVLLNVPKAVEKFVEKRMAE